ncbi:MAG: mannonate dehydratase [Chloroflexi bacterium]|nr:mannonate dehydratase [Chloroflexota bacterium]
MTSLMPGQSASAETYKAIRQRFENYGLKVYRLANHSCHNMPQITLNLPGREAKIEEYLQYIRDLGEAGIYYSTYAHMGNGIWSSGRERIRGGAEARAFHIEDPNKKGHWITEVFEGPLSHGREYSEEELWDNYAYFIQKVVPVAENAGVFIGIHPDDPPVYPLGGVPRCIFGNFEGYKRALEIADSPNIGMCLCVGCWLEGGEAMGKSVEDTIRYFGGLKKLFKVHFRNVTAPMPEGFVETYMDAGYHDMYQVMRALREIDFDGCVISDHLPAMVGGRRAAEAYGLAYIKALIRAVNNEFGGPAGY